MADKKVTVVARIKAKKDMDESVKQELMALVAPTRSEKGCINYDLHRSLNDRSVFMVYENWVSKEDLDKHLTMPYMRDFMEKAKKLLAEPADIALWERIS